MKIRINSNACKVTQGMKNYIEDSLSPIMKIIPEDSAIICSCKVANSTKGFEVTIRSKEYTARAEVYKDDFYTAVEIAIKNLTKTVRKYQKKNIDKKRHKKETLTDFDTIDIEYKNDIVREKTIGVFPLTVEEAQEQLELLDHDFFLYLDKNTNMPSVIYRRAHGGYGVLALDSTKKGETPLAD